MSYYDLPGARFRPIQQWPGTPTPSSQRQWARFRATWSKTLTLLRKELGHLDARNVVVQVAMTERDIRQDGYPRANAKAVHPGVIIGFDSKHGPLQYATDVFDDWEANVRAIALALEALRAVDRYGVTKRGEQYRGWQALPAPTTGPMSVDAAARFIAEHSPGTDPDRVRQIQVNERGARMTAWRAAAAKLHPDHGGDPKLFVRLQEAKRLLDQHGAD